MKWEIKIGFFCGMITALFTLGGFFAGIQVGEQGISQKIADAPCLENTACIQMRDAFMHKIFDYEKEAGLLPEKK